MKKKKRMNKSRIICFVVGIFLLNTNIVFAQENISNDVAYQEATITSNSNEKEWQLNGMYYLGEIVTYNSSKYEVLQTHQNYGDLNLAPDKSQALYKLMENKNKMEIEVLFNSHDEDFIKEITFEDGTSVKDYDYSIKYLQNSRSYTRSGSYALAGYFDYAAWITRDGVVSLSLDPKQSVRTNRSTKNTAWGLLSSSSGGFYSDSRWINTQVIKWQYDCHFDFAYDKATWNLEPNRTANSYIFGVVLKACNP
ncbi:DUF2599 domain-containing protein [Clostridium gasigenes]|uniref:DUF2599 domain-containing protein n=1 Tax=Clostridium gasigenes TaxID=94869 RepID=UPI001C0D736B|nr:DUF2599 domain-containing protein [Clostridium gasigenes]MBU3106113.1 DUF2599 domain-containing protein [Clostridium gasigenes]